MLADPRITIVHITSPNHLHFPQVKAALKAGKHVVCEKPLAMTAAESRELLALARRTKLVNAVNFNVRFYPLVHQAKAMLQKGEIGTPYIVHGGYHQDWLLFPTDWNWRLEPGLGGAMRAVSDIGSHWLDLMSFVTGLRIESVCADFSTFVPVRKKPAKPIDTFTGKLKKTSAKTETADQLSDQNIATEDYAAILLRFENGVRGVMSVSQVSAGRKNRLFFEIDGSKAALGWDGERPNEMWVGHRERPNEILIKDPSLLDPFASQFASYPGGHAEGFPDTFKQLYVAVYRYLQAGNFDAKPDFPTFEDGHYEMQLAEAIWKSAKQGKWVRVRN
jgi:predicted dehydrogenase